MRTVEERPRAVAREWVGQVSQVRHRALVVDDDPDIADLVVMVLEGLEMDVVVARTGAEALSLARERQPDLVTLDLTLPDIDGTEVCEQLRGFTDAYIIMITGRDAEIDRLVGLEVGADEYLSKPFSPRELRARAASLLRRPRVGVPVASDQGSGPDAGAVRASGVAMTDLGHGLLLDPLTGATRYDDVSVPLTPTEGRILVALARRPGVPMERGELVKAVWQGEFIESDFLVDVQVAGLRKKLRTTTGRDWIGVVGGTAYRVKPAQEA